MKWNRNQEEWYFKEVADETRLAHQRFDSDYKAFMKSAEKENSNEEFENE